MKRLCFMLTLLVTSVCAQEPAAFQAPKAYEVQRYEAGWNKNPFTRKTALVPVTNAAFAQDLAIGSFYGALEDPTIVLVNTKTHERFRLRQGQSTPTGIRLAEVNVGTARKETFVQVSFAGETARLRYNEGYLLQMAAASQAKPPAKQPVSPQPATPAVGGTRRLQTSVINMPLLPK
jgi:hypothetical protein